MARLALGSLGLNGWHVGFGIVMGVYPVGLECLLFIGPLLSWPHTFSFFFPEFLTASIKDIPEKAVIKDGHNY